MIERKGQYTTAIIYSDFLEPNVEEQIKTMLNHEAFINPVRLMPDLHKGEGAVIGFTMPLGDKVIPNVVGVDINCAMLYLNLGIKQLPMSREKLDTLIRQTIPFGKEVRDKTVYLDNSFYTSVNATIRLFVMHYNTKFKQKKDLVVIDEKWIEKKNDQLEMNYERFLKSIGTLGGGNHFIEFGRSEQTGDLGFTVHSGSRQFGKKVCEYWQRKAGKNSLDFLVDDDMFGYLIDMIVAQEYAHQNRKLMALNILNILDLNAKEVIETSHNYINFTDFIIRKGAVSSYKDEKIIIPMNMEDGILLCKGKGNPEWNFSAPHGAGRVDSRAWCKKNLKLDEAQGRMNEKDIYASTLPIDETKGAYKDPQIIMDAITPTAEIVDKLIPIMACKDAK